MYRLFVVFLIQKREIFVTTQNFDSYNVKM